MRRNTDGTAPAFGQCLAFLGFKELADGRVRRLLGTSMKANIFLREDVFPMHTTVLLGTGGSSISQPDEFQVKKRSLSSLDR